MLSPYLKPQAINGGLIRSSTVTGFLYGTNDALDKRNLIGPDAAGGLFGGGDVVGIIDAVKDVTESIANAAGIRSPYYIIGEVPKEPGNNSVWSNYDKAAVGIVRAVSSLSKYKQEGVIIDCLGDINANMSVEFTTKPLVYLSNSVIDSRIRKPTIIKATVAVSNHLSDDIGGMIANQISSWDPLGVSNLARDALLYGGNTRAQYALYRLRWLMENGEPFTVYTPHGYYENMLIQNLSPRTDENNMDMLLCDITYQEAILAAPYYTDEQLANRTGTRTAISPGGDTKIGRVKHWLKG